MQPASPAQPAPLASAREVEALIGDLTGVVDALLDLVEEETRLARAGRLSAAARLTARRASQDALAQAAPALRSALRKRHQLFEAALQLNLTVLATARAVAEGILRGASEALARQAMPAAYGARGQNVLPPPARVQPLALSRVL